VVVVVRCAHALRALYGCGDGGGGEGSGRTAAACSSENLRARRHGVQSLAAAGRSFVGYPSFLRAPAGRWNAVRTDGKNDTIRIKSDARTTDISVAHDHDRLRAPRAQSLNESRVSLPCPSPRFTPPTVRRRRRRPAPGAMADDVKYRTEDASNNNVAAAKVRSFSKKPEVDVSFENLTYTAYAFNKFKRGESTSPLRPPPVKPPFSGTTRTTSSVRRRERARARDSRKSP